MILDERSYLIKPEHVKDYLETYVAEGMALQISHLGDLVGWFTTDCGVVNEVVHIWRYRDMGDRERRRAAMEADLAWQRQTAERDAASGEAARGRAHVTPRPSPIPAEHARVAIPEHPSTVLAAPPRRRRPVGSDRLNGHGDRRRRVRCTALGKRGARAQGYDPVFVRAGLYIP